MDMLFLNKILGKRGECNVIIAICMTCIIGIFFTIIGAFYCIHFSDSEMDKVKNLVLQKAIVSYATSTSDATITPRTDIHTEISGSTYITPVMPAPVPIIVPFPIE